MFIFYKKKNTTNELHDLFRIIKNMVFLKMKHLLLLQSYQEGKDKRETQYQISKLIVRLFLRINFFFSNRMNTASYLQRILYKKKTIYGY